MGKKTAKWHDFFQAFFHGLAPAKKPRPDSPFGFAGFAVSFGFALALRLYLAYLAGSWLDDRFDSQPYLLLLAFLIALFLSFWSLFRNFPQE